MFTYICVFEPTKKAQKNGAVPLAIALEANSEKMAKAMAIVYLGEEYADDMSNFNTSKPIICKDIQGFPRLPFGYGWGCNVTEEKLINGAPMSEPIYDDKNKQIGSRFLRDSDGTLIYEQNHSIKILFWYLVECDICAEIESYGATPYMYRTKYGIKTDGEAIKKSLTDAIKKALSMLGFSADVFMGMHDNPEYLADNNIEFEIKAASDKAEDLVRLRKELDDKFTRNTDTMRTAVSKNEIRGIASTLIRELSIHLGNAKAKGDKDYEKYLSGRLRRLNEIEKECLIQLEEANQ